MNEIAQWIFEGEGEHLGHVFVKDKYAIDFCHANPDTSYFCTDCKESVTVEMHNKKRNNHEIT